MMDSEIKSPRSDFISSTQALILDYLELTKPRLVSLSLLSCFVGYFLASPKAINLSLLFATLTGTAFVAAASMVLNQWMERDTDSLMTRTAKRPIPSGRVEPAEALMFGMALAGLGLIVLDLAVHTVCSVIAAVTITTYLFLYTPLKRKTPWCTLIGAIPGALPPLIGWSAAGSIWTPEAWIVLSIVFLWQMPHFYAIAWIYRHDYENAGIQVLSVTHSDGKFIAQQSFVYALLLFPVSFLPSVVGLTGQLYFVTVLFLGLLLLFVSAYGFVNIEKGAKYLFRASIVYLSLIFILMIIDKV